METFAIPVIYRRNKSDPGRRAILSVEELLFLRVAGKQLLFQGLNKKEYTLQATLSDWRILLDGYQFEEVDRGTLVNMNKVSLIYRDLQQVHFSGLEGELFCPIAGAHIARIQRKYPNLHVLNSGAL